jgi:murein L,D-transpeptidase YafK
LRRYLSVALAGGLIATAAALFFQARQKPAANAPTKADMILVEKSARRLTLFCAGRKLKEYRVALGFSPVGPKQHEGDGRTPEGKYKIDFRKSDSAFHRALHISYPDAADSARAAEAGVAPGGDIMIHGLPNGFSALGPAHRSPTGPQAALP